jgi:hypothetical protein
MEQVSGDSDEPNVTRKRGPNPPAALFVEPAVPAQDPHDADASSAEAPSAPDAAKPSGGTPTKGVAAKRAPTGRAKPAPATFEAAPSPSADARSPKLTAQPRSTPTSEGLAIEMPAFSAPETPQIARRLTPKPAPAEPASIEPTAVEPTPAEPTPVAPPPIAPAQRRKATAKKVPPAQRTPATKRAETPVEQPAPAGTPAEIDVSHVTEVPAKTGVPVTSETSLAARTPSKKAVKKATPRKVAKKAAAKAVETAEPPPQQAIVEVVASIEPPRPPVELVASAHSPAPPAEPTEPAPPAEPTLPAEPTALVALETELAVTRTCELTGADLWAAVKAEPRRAPAAVALAIVDRHAPDARQQADWLAETYPAVAPDLLARVAQRNAARRTRVATLASAPFAGLGGLPLLALAQARLVLETAAIFGRDPRDPQRAAEMLVLLGVYRDAEQAAAAVESVTDELREVPPLRLRPRPIGLRLVRRVVGRFWPGAGLLISGLAAINSTNDLGARVIRFYQSGKVG